MPAIANDILSTIYASPILLVDDNRINLIFLEKILQEYGFIKLMSVTSAEEALEKMDEFNPDIVILDIIMPGMDGFECCEAIRQHKLYRDLPVLIQTSVIEPELRVKAFEKGATDFISKPVYPDELCARIRVHLEKRHSMKILQLYKNRIAMELESARQLQLAILPSQEQMREAGQRCKLDLAAYYQPSSEVGGDFWGLNNLFPHQLALCLADFSGHGVAAALNAFRLQAYMKEHSPLAARPGEYVSHLNDKLLHLLLRGQFATMFYGIIDTQSNQLFYATACAPHPIILRKSLRKAELIDGSGKLLGIGMHLYPTATIPFAGGDMLLLYSDALIETPNKEGVMITEEQIIQLMDHHYDASATAMKTILLDFFREHTGNAQLRDDLTLMICTR